MTEKVSAVIPAYNEENTIAGIVQVLKQLPEVGEVIVVSDGSYDHTAVIARTAGATVVELAENRGKGGAIAAGVSYLAQSEVLLLLDADLIGLNPQHILNLVQPVLAGEADMTVGVFSRGKKTTDLAQRIAPYLSGQRALRWSVFAGLRLEDTGYGLEVALTRWAAQNQLRVITVPMLNLTHKVKEIKRGPVHGFFDRLRMYWQIVRTFTRGNRPLTDQLTCPKKRATSHWQVRVGWRSAVVVTALLVTVLIAYDIQFQRASATIGQLSDLPVEAIGQRILVFAPHPDDETLGVGGLIRSALVAGSEVRVVFMTNGDGFRRGAREQYDFPAYTPEEYINYGKLRQREALMALSTLGLDEQHVIFLGYPDGGLAYLWWYYWDANRPFTSRYTKSPTSPYPNSYRLETPYTAPAVLGDVEAILRDFRPTNIFFPHPDDTHPDHWATSAFITAAAARLEQTDRYFQPTQHHYIIHRGSWQILPVVMRTDLLLPPFDLYGSDTFWYRYPLTMETVALKENAIKKYDSQIKLMRKFLLNFARINEILGTLAGKELPETEQVFLMDGNPKEWVGLQPVVNDPKGDALFRRAKLQGDLGALYLAQGRDHLYLRVDTWGKIMRPETYRIALYGLPTASDKQYQRWVFRVQTGSEPLLKWEEWPQGVGEPALSGGIRDHTLEVALPLVITAGEYKLMVGVESWIGSIVLDRTPWWVVSVNQR